MKDRDFIYGEISEIKQIQSHWGLAEGKFLWYSYKNQ